MIKMDRHKFFRLLVRILPIPLFILIWEIIARAGFLNESLFPTPIAVFFAFLNMLKSGELVFDILVTVSRALIGFIFGSILGIIIGIFTARFTLFNQSLGQIIQILRPIPPIALVPLAVVWLGLGEFSKVTIITWGVFFPVWVNTHLGVSRVDKSLIWAALSLGASPKRLLFRVALPAALSHVVAGMRVAVAIAFICVVVSEMLGAYVGLGYRINISYLVFRVDRMIVGLLMLGGLGAFADWIFIRIVNKIMPWFSLKKSA
jgi:ABC-type nitrate/sulfonate/bicarbonate transport system permease component